MGYTPNDTTVGKVLNNNELYYVPRYQRNYIWEKDNWQQLFDDINDVFISTGKVYHFIGSFIFENRNGTCIIIDGQQRLTTLLILLAIICKHQKILGDTSGFNTTKSYCILQSDEGEKTRICNDDYDILSIIVNNYCIEDVVHQNLDDYLKVLGKSLKPKDKPFYNCFNFFNEIIVKRISDFSNNTEKIQYLQSFRNAIINTRVISIIADKEQEGYIIFEILNSRGVPLEEHELLKNYIFMCCRNNADNDIPKELWGNILLNTSTGHSASIKKFLSQYTTHCIKKTSDKKIYLTIKENTPRKKANQLLKDLEKKSKYYYDICNVTENIYTPKIRYCLTFFNRFGISIIRPVLFGLFEAFDDNKLSEKILEDALIKLKNFFSIFVVVCHKKTNEIEELTYKHALLLHNEFSLEALKLFIKSLNEKAPSFEIFKSSIQLINYTNKKGIYSEELKSSKKHCEYILREMELFLSKSDDFILTKFTIEHIKSDSHGGSANLIGNMIPLAKSINKNANDKPVAEKIDFYKQSGFAVTKAFLERYNETRTWDDAEIQSNNDYIARKLYKTIWCLK